jgi:hypothetical protein
MGASDSRAVYSKLTRGPVDLTVRCWTQFRNPRLLAFCQKQGPPPLPNPILPKNQIKDLLNEQISSTAVDSLRDSQQVANEMAKTIIYDVLKDKDTKGKFGELLQFLFAYESVLHPTRWLVYWSLNLDSTMNSIEYQTKWQIDYWAKLDPTLSLKSSLLDSSIYWLKTSEARKYHIDPLLMWTLQQKTVVDPVAGIVVDALPYIKETTVDALKWAVSESLKSEDTKKAVQEGLVYYLKNVGNSVTSASAAASAPGPSSIVESVGK